MTQASLTGRPDRLAPLRRESVRFALLVAFVLAVDLHGMGKPGSIDEGGQMSLGVCRWRPFRSWW